MKDTIQIERLTEISQLADEIAEGLNDLRKARGKLNLSEQWNITVTTDRTATMRARLAEYLDRVKTDKARNDRVKMRNVREGKE
jgi:hypothetical protein